MCSIVHFIVLHKLLLWMPYCESGRTLVDRYKAEVDLHFENISLTLLTLLEIDAYL